MKKILVLIIVVLRIVQCKKETASEIYTATPVAFVIPPHFPQVEQPANNMLTAEGLYLGRKLYYDSLLHPTKSKSCSSCHLQADGFSTLQSNSIPHVNMAWSTSFLWNGAIEGGLEEAMAFEVHEFFATDFDLLRENDVYVTLFEEAFGSTDINLESTSKALAQFLRTLNSSNSDYDQFFRGEKQLTDSQYRGYLIYNSEKGDCFHCHGYPLLADNQFHNTGLDSVFNGSNWGRYEVTRNSADLGKFKTPTLRNIEYTRPYMHDGRFITLEEVVEFYNSGVKHSPTLDPIMTKSGKENGLGLNEQEKKDLVNFMKSFSDKDFLTNPAFNRPK
mgnify:CR=1 FL=1